MVKTIKRPAYALLIERLRRLDLSTSSLVRPPSSKCKTAEHLGMWACSLCDMLALTALRIKNRAPAAIQVTAEQLLRDVRYKSRSDHRVLTQLHRHKNVKSHSFVLLSNESKILRSSMSIVAGSGRSSRNESDKLGVACECH